MLWGLIASCLLCNRPQPADDLWWETGWETGGWWVETGDTGCDPWISLRDDTNQSVVEVDFGQVEGPASVALTLRNRAEGCGVLRVEDIQVTGAGFSVSTTTVTSLNPQESIALILSFDPGIAGAAQGELAIDSNDPFDGALRIPLLAQVPSFDLDLAPESVSFETTLLGCEALSSVTVSNTGQEPVVLEGSAVSEPFAVDTELPLTLDVGASHALALRFAPQEEGEFSETLRVESDVGTVTATLAGSAELAEAIEETAIADGGRDLALVERPREDTLVVRVSGVRVETWVLDTEHNLLRFDEDSVPDAGARVVITFVPQAPCGD